MCYQLLGKERGNILFPSGPLCSSAQGRNDVHHVYEQPERAGAGHGGKKASPGLVSQGTVEPGRDRAAGEGSQRPGQLIGKPGLLSVEESQVPPDQGLLGRRSKNSRSVPCPGIPISLGSPRFLRKNLAYFPLLR